MSLSQQVALDGDDSSGLQSRHPVAVPSRADLVDARNKIDLLDLSSTLERLVKVDGRRSAEAVEAIKQYRNYLYLRRKYPNEALPPSYDVDEVWHAHILHTKEYRDFCKAVFFDHADAYLDHYPHIANARSQLDLNKAFETTQSLYKAEFGDFMRKVFNRSVWMRFSGWIRGKILARYPDLSEA